MEHAQPYFKDIATEKALDIGCATGRASFELTAYFDQVTGLTSRTLYSAGGTAGAKEALRYTLPIKGSWLEI